MLSINRNRPPDAVQNQLDLMKSIGDQQKAISTGKRLIKPSDDPQGWLEVSVIARQQGNEEAWVANIGRAETRAVQAESSMSEITSGLIRAKELVLQSNNDSINAVNREGIAIELEGILANIRDIMTQDDPFGGKLFAEIAIEVPIGGTRHVIASPTAQQLFGKAPGSAPGASMIEDLLLETIDAVRNGTQADRNSRLTPLDGAIDYMTAMLTQQGVARGRLESARNQFIESRVVLAERRQEIEDTNVSEAITKLQALDISLEAAQAVYAKNTQRSLLDYLR